MVLKQLAILFFIFYFNIGYAQTWDSLESEYNNLVKKKQHNLSLDKAKEISHWAVINGGDTSLHYAVSLRYVGDCYFSLSELDSAFTYYYYSYEALNQQNRKEVPDFAILLNLYGNLYYDVGNYEKADSLFTHALKIFKKTFGEEHSLVASNLNKLGNLSCAIGDYNSSEAYYKQAIEIRKKVLGENHPDFALSLSDLGVLYFETGNYKMAEQYYKQAFDIRKIALDNESLDFSSSLTNLGNLYCNSGNYSAAESYLKQAMEIGKKSLGENHSYFANYLNNLGVLYRAMGNYKLAAAYHEQALAIREKSLGKDDPVVATSLNNLGSISSTIGNYEASVSYFKRAIDILGKTLGHIHPRVAVSLNNLGGVYRRMGDYNTALRYYLQALEIREKALGENHPDFSRNLNSIGTLYSDIGDKEEAMRYFWKALEIREKTLSKDHPLVAESLTNIGIIFGIGGDYKEAENYYLQALAIEEKLLSKDHPDLAEILNKLGNLYSITADYKSAEVYYKKGLKINMQLLNQNFNWLNSFEKESYWASQLNYYKNLNYFGFKSYSTFPFFTKYSYKANLISKSLLLENSRDLDKAVAQTKDESIKLQFNEMKNLRRLYSKMQSEGSDKKEIMESFNKQADSLDKILVNKVGEYAAIKRNFELTWEDVKLGITSDEAAIEFVDYYDEKDSFIHYMALVVKKGSKYPQLIKLCSEKELKQLLPEKELKEIYDLIWKPLLPLLTNVKIIYYSPSGLINNIPFQALYKEENDQREYVMDKFTLHQLTSTRYLALDLKKKEQEPIEPSIALFGGINYNDYPNAVIDTLNSEESSKAAFLYKNAIVLNRELDSTRTGASYLPGTKKEVESISDILKSKQWQVDISEGKNATENKIKSFSGKSSKAILHIATHGFAYPDKEEKRKELAFSMMRGNDKYKASDNPMIRSGLLFGGANLTWQGKGDSLLNTTNEDGVLTAYELSQLDLSNTKLAVLSACETGKGAIQGNEGTFGLKRALKLAGVDNMIVSLWKVPDDATMEMMTIFYSELANTKKPVSSFETAQKAMRIKYPEEPKKWAGFVFVR